mgnify:CR=1 FL=1
MGSVSKKIQQVGKSVMALLSARTVNLLLMALFSILLGRELGAEQFGIFSISLIIMRLFRTITEAGYEIKIPRDAANNPEHIKSLLLEARDLKNLLWLIVLLPASVAGYLIIGEAVFIVALFWIYPFGVSSSLMSLLRGIDKMGVLARIESFVKASLFLVNILWIFILPDLYLIFATFVVFEIIASLILWRAVSKHSGTALPAFSELWKINFGSEKFKKEILSEQLRLTGLNFLTVIQFRMSTLALGIFATNTAVGLFSAGQRFLTFMRIIPHSVMNVLLPEFSRENEEQHFSSLIMISAVIGALFSYLLWEFAEPLMMLTFRFEDAIPVLQILAWTFFPLMVKSSAEAYLIARHKEKIVNITFSISAVIIFVVILLFINTLGALAAALAALFGELFAAVTLLIAAAFGKKN